MSTSLPARRPGFPDLSAQGPTGLRVAAQPKSADAMFGVEVFRAGDVWWVEVRARQTGRAVIAFYHPDELEARDRVTQLEEELTSVTPDEFRGSHGIA